MRVPHINRHKRIACASIYWGNSHFLTQISSHTERNKCRAQFKPAYKHCLCAVSSTSFPRFSLCRSRSNPKQFQCVPVGYRRNFLLASFMDFILCMNRDTSSKSPRVTSNIYSNSPIAIISTDRAHAIIYLFVFIAFPTRTRHSHGGKKTNRQRGNCVGLCQRVPPKLFIHILSFFSSLLFHSRVAYFVSGSARIGVSVDANQGTFPVAGNSCLFFYCTLLILCM